MILDTNIIIRWLNSDAKVIEFFENNLDKHFRISVITEMEVLLGREKHLNIEEDTFRKLIKQFEIVPLSSSIGNCVVAELKKSSEFALRKTKFQDMIITCTALYLDEPLITFDKKDFKRFTRLKVIRPD